MPDVLLHLQGTQQHANAPRMILNLTSKSLNIILLPNCPLHSTSTFLQCCQTPLLPGCIFQALEFAISPYESFHACLAFFDSSDQCRELSRLRRVRRYCFDAIEPASEALQLTPKLFVVSLCAVGIAEAVDDVYEGVDAGDEIAHGDTESNHD